MKGSRVLFIGGSIGLGHAGRDVAIARALRALNPSVEISWLAGDPVRRLIADAGETLLSESVTDETTSAEHVAGRYALNVAQYAWRVRHAWNQNVATFRQVTGKHTFDLVIGDETYELVGAIAEHPELKRAPFTMIYDFVGLDAASHNPLERLLVHVVNRSWCRGGKPPVEDLFEHLAACDLAIVQGGGTTTLELTALWRPFIYFPLQGHFEQEVMVAGRIQRQQAGEQLRYASTTPKGLAAAAVRLLAAEPTWPPHPV